jgi:putative membrane protein
MEYYNYILAFHIMAVLSWMAMLFYQPRLYVYHVEYKKNGSAFTDVIKIQERKLYNFIGVPAFWASLISGSIMIVLNPHMLSSGYWLWIKLFALIMMIFFHYILGYFLKKLADDDCDKSGKYFRVLNEVPTLLMIIIVIMAVIKPF